MGNFDQQQGREPILRKLTQDPVVKCWSHYSNLGSSNFKKPMFLNNTLYYLFSYIYNTNNLIANVLGSDSRCFFILGLVNISRPLLSAKNHAEHSFNLSNTPAQ